MPRVKRGNKRRLKRKKILRRAKGYYLAKSKLYRIAKEQVQRSLDGFVCNVVETGSHDRFPHVGAEPGDFPQTFLIDRGFLFEVAVDPTAESERRSVSYQ